MALAVVILAFGCLIAAAYLWQRSKKLAADGVPHRGLNIAIVVLSLLGVLLALSAVTIFRGGA